MIYKDSKYSIEERVENLLSLMTTEEKIGQLTQLDGRVDMEKMFKEQHPGSFLQVLGEDSKKAIELARNSRLGIPLLLGVDAIHGHSFWKGAIIFPTQLTMACTWNKELIKESAKITALEMRNTGSSWTFSPVLCLTRDLRWGRVGETFGEDPYLIGEFAEAMIKGYQGNDLKNPNSVLATAKHYAGYSETQGGRDASEADISKRKLESYFLPPFKKAVDAGVGSFMTGYQSMEGVPSTANSWLLKEKLKDEWLFDGFLVTDWDNVGTMVKIQKICKDYKEAATLAIKSGNDMMMNTPEFFKGAIEAFNEGLLVDEDLNDAVKRVLRIKFRLGLFEDDRMPNIEKNRELCGCKEHRDVALQCARESLVLLSNDGLLPLNEENIKTIAVVGPNCNDRLTQLGDWSLGTGQIGHESGLNPDELIITALDGIRARFSGEVLYYDGYSIEKLTEICKKADIIVNVVGDKHKYVGEYKSTATLELQDGQIEMINSLKELKIPTVSVLINSKPLVLPNSLYTTNAVIEQFSPGMLGGQALAEAIFGDYNPCGKLTISFPYHVGQQPIYYSQVRGQHGNTYADMSQDPLYAFGFGKSYTSFEYFDLKVKKCIHNISDNIEISYSIKNTGDFDGTEISQVYISDLVTSATWVDKELKAYSRDFIKKGETVNVNLSIPVSELTIVNKDSIRLVEPGDFNILVGSSSRIQDLKTLLITVE